MDWARQCVAVIPCFNEAGRIVEVVHGVQRYLPTVLVVDDGSTDATAERALAAGAEVLRQPANHGKGAALRAGWQAAREHGFAWALTLDGDGQHAPEEIPAFFDCAERTGAALVSGERMSHPAGMPWVRRQVNRWLSRRLSKLTGVRLADTQCGFRLVNLDAWSRTTLSTGRYEVESEMLLAFLAAGHKVEFVPVRVIYRTERSKINPVVDAARWLRWWLPRRQARRAAQRQAR